MRSYNFHDLLSPIDFEELSRDLLQNHLGLFLESFKTGQDGGIDLRYSSDKDQQTIVQCKCYPNYEKLIPTLKKEAKKVSKLKPNRYILTTSAGLLPQHKDNIKKIFEPYILNTSDILGKDDLNNLLSQYTSIEKSYYKLWLSSTEILTKIINNDVWNRSEFTREKIERNIRLYVKNNSLDEALNILDNSYVVIISGIPGIGKTTLARLLVYDFLVDGYEFVSISSDISEAEKVFEVGKHQVFYYDDFLGRNFLEDKLPKNEDRRLTNFILRIQRDDTKRLIMTTREYILNQAKQRYEVLEQESIDVTKCIVDLSQYHSDIRAQILYNHLYFSELSLSYISNLLIDTAYLKIISHKNYNPRIIEQVTNKKLLKKEGVSSTDFSQYFLKALEYPLFVWDHAFSSQISSYAQNLLLVLLCMGRAVDLDSLESAFDSYYKGQTDEINKYTNALKELDGTFIYIYRSDSEHLVSFHNPSVADFLLEKLNQSKSWIRNLICNAVFFEQLCFVFTTPEKNSINKIILDNELETLLASTIANKYNSLKSYNDFNKLERIYYLCQISSPKTNQKIKELISTTLQDVEVEHLDDLDGYENLEPILSDIKNCVPIEKFSAFVEYVLDSAYFLYELDYVLSIENEFPKEFQDYGKSLSSFAEELINNETDQAINNLHRLNLFDIEQLIEKIHSIEYEFGIDCSDNVTKLQNLDFDSNKKIDKPSSNSRWHNTSSSISDDIASDTIREQFEELLVIKQELNS